MNNFYVYIHRKKSNNEIFYVGKGRKKRAYGIHGRSSHWNNIVNKYGRIVEILKDNLTETEAFNLEMQTIKEYKNKNINLCNKTDGGEGMTGFKHSTETINKLIEESSFTDKTIYVFKNTNTNEIIKTTKNKFKHKTKIDHANIKRICDGTQGKMKDWICLNPLKKFVKKSLKNKFVGTNAFHYDHTIRIFENINGLKEVCTTADLKIKYNLQCHINAVVLGKRLTHKGWKYLGVAETTPKA